MAKILTEEAWKDFIKATPEFKAECEEFKREYQQETANQTEGYIVMKERKIDGDLVDIYYDIETGEFDPVWVGQYK